MNTTASVHFAKSTFWTIDRHSKAHAMRRYRSLWRGLNSKSQWALECKVYMLRGNGIPEEQIMQIIEMTLNINRPWRLNDKKLLKLFCKIRRR